MTFFFTNLLYGALIQPLQYSINMYSAYHKTKAFLSIYYYYLLLSLIHIMRWKFSAIRCVFGAYNVVNSLQKIVDTFSITLHPFPYMEQ